MAGKDVEKLVAHYAADGVLIAPEMPSAKGKDAIRRSLKETFANPNARLEFTTEKRRSRRPVTWLTHAVHTPRPIRIQTMKPVNDKGSFVTVYKKIGADWLAVADINTSEVH